MSALTEWWVKRTITTQDVSRAWETQEAPYRQYIPVAVGLLPHVSSVYELGCGSGVNLRILQRAYPHLRLGGLEPSPQYRAWAQEHLGVSIDEGRLPTVPAEPWDVYLSCYTLAYCTPEEALASLKALNGHGLVLLEPMAGVLGRAEGVHLPPGGIPEYTHEYGALLQEAGWRPSWRWPVLPTAFRMNCLIVAER